MGHDSVVLLRVTTSACMACVHEPWKPCPTCSNPSISRTQAHTHMVLVRFSCFSTDGTTWACDQLVTLISQDPSKVTALRRCYEKSSIRFILREKTQGTFDYITPS